MKKTSLYNNHISLNAKMVPFAGYYMPVNYEKGLQHEYNAVRKSVGMFDVSHMGQIIITGEDALEFLNLITTNKIEKLNINDAQYSTMCNHDGGIIDDIIIYKIKSDKFLMIVNASNIMKNYDWIQKCKIENKFDVLIDNQSDDFSLIAIQGPESREVLSNILNNKINLKFYTFQQNKDLIISRTGYTGELGFELIGKHNIIKKYWELLIQKSVVPCGLAVRDVLRMEMKYCLYGNDININNNPIEAGLHWIVDKDKNQFIGSDVIKADFENGPRNKLICFKFIDRGIPRSGYKIFYDNKEIGSVTSGTFSIGLQKGIGLGYIDSKFDKKNIFIEIRTKLYEAKIVRPPFIKSTSLHS